MTKTLTAFLLTACSLAVMPNHSGGPSASTSQSEPLIDFSFIKGLASCIEFQVLNVESNGNIVTVELSAKEKQNIGACGCRSRALAYSVFERVEIGDDTGIFDRLRGRVVLDERLIVIGATDDRLWIGGDGVIEFSCLPAD